MATETQPPSDASTLTPIMFHILLALADGEKHGYGILKAVEQETDGQISLLTGTLYRAIKRLEDAGLIDESDERPDPNMDDERRRYYRLSGVGRKLVQAEAERLEQVVTVARRKQLLRAPKPM